MKKNLIIIAAAIGVFVLGGTAHAMIDVVADQIAKKSVQVEAKTDKQYQEYQEEKRHMVLTSTDKVVQENLKRMEKEVMDYYYQQQYNDLNRTIKEDTADIESLTNQKIEELKKHVDQLFKGAKKK